MKLNYRNFCIVCLCVVAIAAGSSMQSSKALAQAEPKATMPANYRSLIARHILSEMALDQKTLNTAMISKPYDKWGGLIRGGTMPTVCVSIDTRNMLGMEFKGYFLFSVLKGEVHRLATGNALIDACPPFSAFHEVMKR